MARRNIRQTGFDAIRIEGSLLPAEFLNTLANFQAPHQRAADYGIDPGLKLRDEIGRYWRIGHSLWQSYDQQSQRDDLEAEDVGVQRWLARFIKRVLGYEDLHDTAPLERDGRCFPISHLAIDNQVPLVLTTRDHPLDKGDARFGEEGRRRSPHGLAQEYLNAEDRCLWALVSNGTHLRLLRDNPSLTRPAYIEVNLDRMFREELYADFAAFWLLCHVSRLRPTEPGHPESCIIESWRHQAEETGVRALDHLRDGVEKALRELGTGFLEHRDNRNLREKITSGQINEQAYYQQLLRLIYRFLFLFTTEDRNILHLPQASAGVRSLYHDGYSLDRLRESAIARASYDRHHDLWEGLKITFGALRSGQIELGLPALGGLFAEDQCPDLDAACLPNRRLLAAIHALAWQQTQNNLSRVNYRDMGTEELGSVYESLLELEPVIRVDSTPWAFAFLGDPLPGQTVEKPRKGKGSARKTTGSYYTPDSLVQELIQSALVPVIERTLAQNRKQPVEALLSLKIVDPAAGSGHFLLAAARRLAAEVARLRAGADQPTEADYRHALREVVAHCIYGVDLNPLAVELCKTALWLETVEPGKPLGFLDAHIRVGNAVVGVLDPAIFTKGIPDDAYKPLAGDDRKTCTQLKKANKAAREGGVRTLDFSTAIAEPELCAVDLDHMPEDTPEQVAAKRTAWEAAQQSDACRHQREGADLFTAAFFAPKRPETLDAVPTSADLLAWREGGTVRPTALKLARSLAGEHRFFHWYIEFPEVFARGGFDCVLGNPPWDVKQLAEEEYFSTRAPLIAAMESDARKEAIQQLKNEQPHLWNEYQGDKRIIEAENQFIRGSGRFPLTAHGKINLYAIFSEASLNLIGDQGRGGIIVQSGIATDDSTKAYFEHLTSGQRLAALYGFANRERLFPAVGSLITFVLMTLSSQEKQADFLFFATRVAHLRDPRRHFTLSAADIHLLNPNTHTCPVFRSRRDAELTKKIYRRVPVLVNETQGLDGNPWRIKFRQGLFNMTADKPLFRKRVNLLEAGASPDGPDWVLPDGEIYVPLYEAKMVHQFDHRWAEYEEDGKTTRDLTDADHADSNRTARPRYWVPRAEVEDRLAPRDWKHGWLLGWRDICRSTDERTVIAGVVPRVGCGDTFLLMFPGIGDVPRIACLLADQNSLVHDYVARQKIGGTHLKYHVKKQITYLPPEAYTQADLDFIVPRVLELTYTAHDLRPWAEDLGYSGGPFPWNPERRRLLRAELDAWYARLYGLTRDELRYILDPADVEGEDYPSETFRVLKKKEINQFGDYRTRSMVLEAWDRLVPDHAV